MSVMSRFMAWLSKLPSVETRDIVVDKNIKIPMSDGIILLANHYYPRHKGKRPTILLRSPYGRNGFDYYGRIFAEHGFQVFIQSCRGTFGSGGEIDPFHQEHDDGLATLEWIKKQDWFSGELATFGGSYLGHAQWAIASEAGPELKAMALQVTAPSMRRAIFPGESLSLDIFLRWVSGIENYTAKQMFKVSCNLNKACDHLPLNEADRIASGKTVRFWQELLKHYQPGDDWWKTQDFWDSVPKVTAPVHLLGGWYDFFLPDTVRTYEMLCNSGHQPYLIIGPWAHSSWQMMLHDIPEALAWFRAQILDDHRGLRELPVRIYVMGANEWRDYSSWPPREVASQHWYLQPNHGLAQQEPEASGPDHYCYNPTNPTPAIGGIANGSNFGPKDQKKLEARSDVLLYTSTPLERELVIIGTIKAELFVKSSLEHTDFFVCLCDVDPKGKSVNITSSILRIDPDYPKSGKDSYRKVAIDLWPTAYRFCSGHRIRLQVSSGAHPHFARNPGSGEPLGTATTLKIAEQSVYHDPVHPSAIILPVVDYSNN